MSYIELNAKTLSYSLKRYRQEEGYLLT